MQVELAKENEDGSAVFTFDMTPQETKMMVLYGIKCAIEAALKDAEAWDGDKDLQAQQLESIMQQVFIVMIETQYEGSWHWDVHRVFATMQAAKDYISNQNRGYYKDCDFDIQTEEVYA